jgi:hypothetical protein
MPEMTRLELASQILGVELDTGKSVTESLPTLEKVKASRNTIDNTAIAFLGMGKAFRIAYDTAVARVSSPLRLDALLPFV